ncbi:RluA family pseudouridine synthase [Roseomonas xinghualingensis]|uniref:RluA family pseudouridine synthase n=1 Tax=Roseomonas xinghualingensis TaxID=2986475 RepID=UPI0021F1516C|nr:RNA pseudouridine synthase [Roseomonas sp. SXEYE001]MCV4209280.1 RNA pseudouridine synthase [Roseomonas sp. SXEYE001]
MRDPSSLPSWLAGRILLIRPEAMVIDKPAGLPLDPGRPKPGISGSNRGTNASLADWLPLLQLGKRHLPQPAHRLDQDTAGCLVLGRTKPALAALNTLFAERRAEKTYWALVTGQPRGESGTIDAPLRKISSREAGWRMEAHPDGQPARTAWRVLGRSEDTAWLELRPTTGRTHQLRVHCALLGCPILNDPLYGRLPSVPGRAPPGPMHLLARAIALPLDPPLAATAPIPPEMAAAFARCGATPGA